MPAAVTKWQTVSLEFSPFEQLKKPLTGVLKVLHTIEAVLEKILALVKAFSLDFLNPVRAIVAVLLAAIRTLINQLRSTGFSFLLIHPDFSRQDVGAVLASVSGAYPRFEQKLIYKLNDESDVFKPTYPSGSSVAMVVFYVGADSPGDLMSQIFALLRFLRSPTGNMVFPAPVDLKVRPIMKGNDALGQAAAVVNKFSDLFSTDFEKSLSLEWRMPMAPSGGNAPGFINSMVSFYQSFRFPSFVIERSEVPGGETLEIGINTPTTGKVLEGPLSRFNMKKPSSKFFIKEPDESTPYRFFEKKFPIGAGYGATGVAGIARGALTGTYKFIDADPSLIPGKAYYYRVRAFFGKPDAWLKSTKSDFGSTSSPLLKVSNTKASVDYGNGVAMGRASAVVRGFVPLPPPSGFNAYDHVADAITAGLLLNFELPPASSSDSPEVKNQKTGWGCLSIMGGSMSSYKAAAADSESFKNSFFAKAAVRRVANLVAGSVYTNSQMSRALDAGWSSGVQRVVSKILNPGSSSGSELKLTWKFPKYSVGDVSVGFSESTDLRIAGYLGLESSYVDGMRDLDGPYPVSKFLVSEFDIACTVEEREALAGFIGTALASLGTNTSYLHWYSVTLGDLFPAFIPFIFDFEQFILSLLKALESAMSEIVAIIETIIQKIKQLEQILEQILAIIDLLSISVRVSVFAYADTNGSVDKMVETIQSSEDKPGSSPFGLHSGMVLTAGGPGEGSIAALKALAFLVGIHI